jgi:hypothetical protein
MFIFSVKIFDVTSVSASGSLPVTHLKTPTKVKPEVDNNTKEPPEKGYNE